MREMIEILNSISIKLGDSQMTVKNRHILTFRPEAPKILDPTFTTMQLTRLFFIRPHSAWQQPSFTLHASNL